MSPSKKVNSGFSTSSNADDKKAYKRKNKKSKSGEKKTISKRKFRNFLRAFVQKLTNFEAVSPSYNSGFLISIPTIILVSIGTISVISATSVLSVGAGSGVLSVFIKPGIFFLAAMFVYYVAKMFSIEFYKQLSKYIVWLFVILQVFTVFVGTAISGNTNWITVLGFTFQPSEFLKFAIILFLALQFSDSSFESVELEEILRSGWENTLQFFVKMFINYSPAILGGAFVMVGRDMGTFMIIAVFVFIMMIVAGVRTRYLSYITLLGVLGAVFAVITSTSRRTRVLAFIFGDATVSERDSQSLQSLWGLASGGLTGLGAGASREKWGYLPAAKTDFIYAVIGEEFGLLGTLLILALFIMLAYGLFALMFSHKDPYVKLAVAGIASWITVQAIVNILVVIGFAPVLGVPLPLISSGGSSLMSAIAALGFCVRAAQEQAGLAKKDRKFVKKGKAIPVYQSKKVNSAKLKSDFKRPNKPRIIRDDK
ncbi:FtsW/RodA/SpoVE family cell cycle protein [Actinomyces sp. zg-332]|uniref:FtsW/RodA/SpoVE family cell cycle protein n=1 Tax=Actinomyces sp. zg-332 TaxID=2708340 RepID=UPI001422A422|nr:FtsW/RodA/SpoVE family cell cycle protein [Actinomyces sp. zg-332]QPK94426.1 FtsW/RodA/SpoVE family cell cycle protein [Actinomyces sp. zg-332]